MSVSNTDHSGPLNYLEDNGKYSGIFSWIFSTDHKRVGIMYMVSIMTFFFVAVVLGLLIRLELIAPGQTIVKPETYNSLFTLHGVIMIFLFIVPGIPAMFGNFLLPLQIGAEDVAFPRLNLLSWWIYMFGALLAILSLFTFGGTPDTGWTFYVPYSVKSGTNVTMALFAAFVLGFSSILTGLNFITTIHMMRAKGMTWFRMPLFVWSLYATAWIQLLATPIVGITLIMVILERTLGIPLFDPKLGGDPILYQHLFWIYSHPAVYIMILPAMGVVSEILPAAAQKRIFGYKAIAFSSMAIAFVGYLVWGHHMYTSGISDTARIFFSLLTFLVAIPSGIKVFNWLATLHKGSITFSPPLLYTLSFIFLFSIGGLTGLFNGALATDVHLHDTHFVVAHFHYIMFGGTGFALFTAFLFWFPKMTGKMYNFKKIYTAWIFKIIGFNLLYFPMLLLGLLGMPRRYYDYVPRFHGLNLAATIGSWILVIGLFLFFKELIRAARSGEKAEANPWNAKPLEWQTSSPPPKLNFIEPPVVTTHPYDYDNKENA